MQFDVDRRTILLVRHGSYAYGLNTPQSDEDFKGVCIKPKEAYFGFVQRFEQFEHMGSKTDGVDKVVYSLDKFVKLAADCNPNIIEVLHVDDFDVLACDAFGEELRDKRNDFISKKAKHTFSGYAHTQLKRIKTHREWITNPPTEPPSREKFGLSAETKLSPSELGAAQAQWKSELEMQQAGLPKNLITLYTKEHQYQAAATRWTQYQTWLKTRNPARANLELKFGYDTKHGSHLIRLMRMCKEIMSGMGVIVKRPDREELLAIKMGGRELDSLIEEAERLEAECDELYVTSHLRKEPDRAMLDAWLVDLTDRYLTKHG